MTDATQMKRRATSTTTAAPSVSSPAATVTRRPFRIASRRRPIVTTTTTTQATTLGSTLALESEESLQDIGDIDAIEDPSLEPKSSNKAPKTPRRPFINLKEETKDQNPSATNEEESKRQSKKYSASFRDNQLRDILMKEEITTKAGTTIEEYNAETVLALATHQLITAPLPSVTEYDEGTKPTRPKTKETTYTNTPYDYSTYTNPTQDYSTAESYGVYDTPKITTVYEEGKTTGFTGSQGPEYTVTYEPYDLKTTRGETNPTTLEDITTTDSKQTVTELRTTNTDSKYTYVTDYPTTAERQYTNFPTYQAGISTTYEVPQTTFAARETTFAPKETTFAPKETTFTSRQTSFEPRETSFASRETTFAPKETSFASRQTTFAPKETSFASRQTTFAPKETSFTSRETTFAPKETSFTSRETTFAPKETTFASRETTFAQKETTFEPKSETLRYTTPVYRSRTVTIPTTSFNPPESSTSSYFIESKSPRGFSAPNVITSGYSGVQRGGAKYQTDYVTEDGYSTSGYRSSSKDPAYFTREYLLESPVTKTYDDEYQYLSSTEPTQRKVFRKKIQRRISTTLRPTTAYVEETTTIKPRVTSRPKVTKAEPIRTHKPVVNYDYYDDSAERMALKYAEGTKVILHGKGSIECLDVGNFPHPSSCKKFISCARLEFGSLLGWEYVCPKGLSFDPVGGICNWSAGLGCNEKD